MLNVSRLFHAKKLIKLTRKLSELLGRADDAAFLQLSWAANALQSKKSPDVKKYINHPPEAKTEGKLSKYSIHQWEIETLINLLLIYPKQEASLGPEKILNCKEFGALCQVVNTLRSLENSESAVSLHNNNILLELHRIGQRQFGWQRGYATTERLFRFVYVYGQGECAKYFETKHGLSIQQFIEASFILFAQLSTTPWSHPPHTKEIEFDQNLINKSLSILSYPLNEIREKARNLYELQSKNNKRIAYLPSILRQFPIISSRKNETIISPLPELIIYRSTIGLYYDIRQGPQQLLAESNDRFEQYTKEIIQKFYPRFEVLPSRKYRIKKSREVDTPDVLIKDADEIKVVIECKGTKLTFDAQFAEQPAQTAEKAYKQIAKGVTQIWKFFSHVRQGIFTEFPVSANASGVLLTMDSWGQASSELQTEIILKAKELISDDHTITDEDMRPIIFCPTQELIDVLFISTEDQLLTTLTNAQTPEYQGWGLRQVRGNIGEEEITKEFPFETGELLGWMDRFKRHGKEHSG